MNLAELAAWRSYLWPGDVLRNKLGLRDPAAFAAAEALLTRVRLEQEFPPFILSVDGYRAIHRHIFQDLYLWAGEFRIANMRHPNHQAFFCITDHIAGQMAAAFQKMADLDLASHETPATFASAIAPAMSDLNAIHPFRDGNGRTMRVFIDQWARTRGLLFDQPRLDPDAWNEASRLSFMTAESDGLRDVIQSALVPQTDT